MGRCVVIAAHLKHVTEARALLVGVVTRGAYLVDELLGEDGGGGGVSTGGYGGASLAVYLVGVPLVSGSVAAEVLALQN